jgi:diaminopimelate decarboxylase
MAKRLAKRYGTPLLALSRSVLRENFESLQKSLPNVTLSSVGG